MMEMTGHISESMFMKWAHNDMAESEGVGGYLGKQ